MRVEAPAQGVVLLRISGRDVGEFGHEPIEAVERLLGEEPSAFFFVDARDTQGVSIDVSNAWAQWLLNNRDRLNRVHMLVGSQFIRITAEFVRRFAELESLMVIQTNATEFDRALGDAVGR